MAKFVSERTLVLGTGIWTLTDAIDAAGEPIARQATRAFEPGEEIDGELFPVEDQDAYLAEGLILLADSPAGLGIKRSLGRK